MFLLDKLEITLISVIAALVVILVVILLVLANKKKKKNSRIIDGVKYDHANSNDDYTLQHKDIIIQKGVEYKVEKGGVIIPGKYQIFAGDERTKEINVRMTDFVKSFSSGSSIVLAEGDKITALSHNAILR